MADVALSELYARARLESGLRANAYYDNSQILYSLNAGGAELYDLFTAANQKYNVSTYDFTTTGVSSAIQTLPTDFQQGHSLEIYPDLPGRTRTIRYLSNWLNRNSYGTNVFSLAPGGFDPVYTFLDNKLRFYPPQCTPAAPFRLYYTPLWTPLADPVTVNFNIASGDTPSVPPPGGLAGTGAWLLANATFPSDIPTTGGFNLVLTFTTTNLGFSGTYPVVSVGGPPSFGQPTFGTSTLASTAGYSNPATGTGTYTYQPVGTRGTLSGAVAPWSEYLVLYAAIAINIDRQRGTGELERKLAALKLRIQSIIADRQEEPQQPPLTRGGYSDFGSGWGGGGWL